MLPKMILIPVPEGEDAGMCLAVVTTALRMPVRCLQKAQDRADKLADSARFLDLEARRKPKPEDHMCDPEGCTRCVRVEGYNACLEDIDKGD